MGQDNPAWRDAPGASWWRGWRVKDRRHEPVHPSGRASLTLFERVTDDGRPHPRLRVALTPAEDPDPAAVAVEAPAEAPATAEAFAAWVDQVVDQVGPRCDPGLQDGARSPHHARHSVRVQRVARLVARLRDEAAALPASDADAAALHVARREAELYAGELPFDDEDTGTYHSFGHDAPFVHFLETMLRTLPDEGTDDLDRLDGGQQEAVRRQRVQARAWLDHLMRHKYAHDGVTETDVERTVGGFLIDRDTRLVVSETAASRDALVPAYELLRVDPSADHPHAGAWLARDGDTLVLQGAFASPPDVAGDAVVDVPAELLRHTPVPADRVTFRRAPKHPRLRAGVRLDWDRNGWVAAEPIGWIGWAGHCDIKAIVEAAGITLRGHPTPTVREYRSDTDQDVVYGRSLLLEILCAAIELGSVYARADGSGVLQRGVHRFGGARNDSLPDRLQLTGKVDGKGLRWPLGGREGELVVTAAWAPVRADEVEDPEHPGLAKLDLATAFRREVPDAEGLGFHDNPRFLKTVEGDYGLIDVSGALLRVSRVEHGFDPRTGYPTRTPVEGEIDLRAGATGRVLLGTWLKDAAARELYRVEVDRDAETVVATVLRHVRDDAGQYVAEPVPDAEIRLPLRRPLVATLSRESKLDDPALLDAVLARAVRFAEGICADTDQAAEVWNGAVTGLRVVKEAEDGRLEAWRVEMKARFGSAVLRYRLRRDARGEPEAWCPLPGTAGAEPCDFLWQDLPDVASKGVEGGDWVVNRTMRDRGIVDVAWSPSTPGGVYVHDEQVKNAFELLWCGLAGVTHTVVHDNKRWAFDDEASWSEAVRELRALRDARAPAIS